VTFRVLAEIYVWCGLCRCDVLNIQVAGESVIKLLNLVALGGLIPNSDSSRHDVEGLQLVRQLILRDRSSRFSLLRPRPTFQLAKLGSKSFAKNPIDTLRLKNHANVCE